MNRWIYWFSAVFVLGITGVLMGGFVVQFAGGEHPCPLCVLQRMFLMLTALGLAAVLVKARRAALEPRDIAHGYGLAIVAALCGAAVSTRQVLLHILPNDPGYGGSVLGLHLYTWALITFLLVVLASGIVLALLGRDEVASQPRLGVAVAWVFAAVVVANLVTTFALQGFHWVLPDDPTRYELFTDLGITD